MTEWKCFVGEEHTFYGIYHDYYEDFEEHWKADSTQRSNRLRYCKQNFFALTGRAGGILFTRKRLDTGMSSRKNKNHKTSPFIQ